MSLGLCKLLVVLHQSTVPFQVLSGAVLEEEGRRKRREERRKKRNEEGGRRKKRKEEGGGRKMRKERKKRRGGRGRGEAITLFMTVYICLATHTQLFPYCKSI